MLHSRMIFLLSVLVGLSAWGACAEARPAAAPPAAKQGQQLSRLASVFRRSRTSPKRRAEAVEQLAALGPRGIDTAKDLIDKELRRFATALKSASPPTTLDKEIDQLRKVLAKLRADPALTKEKIERVGLPALNGLTVLQRQRQVQWLRHQARFRRTGEQLGQFDEFLRILESKRRAAAPLPLRDYRQQLDRLLAKIVDPEYEEAQRIMAENAKLAPRLDPEAVAGMRGLNELRVVCGLRPLVVDLKLCQAATEHSADMRLHKFFSHESPLPGKRTFEDRAKRAGTTASAENIHTGGVSASSAGKAWFLSPGHHKNMLGENHRRQGLGHSGDYWTHMFGP